MRIACIPTLVAALAATGCVTHPYQAAMPNLAGQCAASLEGIDAIPLRYPSDTGRKGPQYEEFAALSHCYRAGDAPPVPVAMYHLEDVAPPSRIHVEVMLSTGGTFAAAVDTLDANRQLLAHHAFDRFVRRGAQYSLDLFLNAGDVTPSYIVLRPDEQKVGKVDTTIGSVNQAVPIAAGGVMWMYNNGVETAAVRPLLQGGKVLVTVAPQTATALGGKE
jgi:hypothetical protein